MGIEELGNIDDIETGVGQGDYEPPSDNVKPPPAQVYTFLRVDANDDDYSAERKLDKQGKPFIFARFRAQIQGGDHDGRMVFPMINTMVSSFRPGSSADDYLRACRSPERPTTIKGYEQALAKTFGPFNAKTTWEWRCRDCETTFLRGAKNPKPPKKYEGPKVIVKKNADGSIPWEIACPECHQTVGAQLVITDFVVPRSNNGVSGPRPVEATATATNLPPAAG